MRSHGREIRRTKYAETHPDMIEIIASFPLNENEKGITESGIHRHTSPQIQKFYDRLQKTSEIRAEKKE